MKYILCVIAFLCQGWLFGQPPKALTVGDSIPDLALSPFLNAPYTAYKLSAQSRLDSLQKRFGDSISILVVGYESPDRIRQFLKTNARVKNNHLPFLTGDSLLNQTFPHYLIPHEVWIKNGKVIAITDAESLSRVSIQAALAGYPLQLPLKKDILDFNPSISLRKQLAVGDSSLFLRQNLFTQQVEGLGTRRGVQLTAGTKRVYFINWGLLSLFQHAWKFQANHVVLDLNDPSTYLDRTSNPDEWKRNNLFCYEGVFPLNCPDSLVWEDLKSSLQSASPLQGSWQKRMLPVYILVKEASGPPASALLHPIFKKDAGTDSIYMQGHTLAAITAICNESTQPSPGKPIILNETGIEYPIDLMIPAKALSDPDLLRMALAHHKLRLIPAIRELSVFVLTANPFYHAPGKK